MTALAKTAAISQSPGFIYTDGATSPVDAAGRGQADRAVAGAQSLGRTWIS
jgi:hypothetical protein